MGGSRSRPVRANCRLRTIFRRKSRRTHELKLRGIAAQLAWRVRHLPRLHADPFDQMLISKALCERLTLVTHDRLMADYGVPILAT